MNLKIDCLENFVWYMYSLYLFWVNPSYQRRLKLKTTEKWRTSYNSNYTWPKLLLQSRNNHYTNTLSLHAWCTIARTYYNEALHLFIDVSYIVYSGYDKGCTLLLPTCGEPWLCYQVLQFNMHHYKETLVTTCTVTVWVETNCLSHSNLQHCLVLLWTPSAAVCTHFSFNEQVFHNKGVWELNNDCFT